MKLKSLNKRAISGAAAAIVIVLMLIVSGVVGFGFYTSWTFKLSPTGGGGGAGAPKGSYTIQCFGFDSLNTVTTRVIVTDVQIQYYSQISGMWQQLGAAPLAATGYSPITLTGQESGYIYAVVTCSSSYYVDIAKTTQMNSMLTYIGYENVLGGASLPQWVFKINVNGIVPGNRATADIILNFYIITSATFAFGTVPTNITSVGTSLNTTYLPWYMYSPTVNTGTFVRQITLSTNDTNPAYQTFYKQNIPNLGFLNGGTFSVSTQATAIVYSWTATTNALTGAVDLGSAIVWTYGSGSTNKFDLSTAIQSTLPAAWHEQWTITVYTLTPAGAGASATQNMQFMT
jgi:hypothetical protein